MKEWPRWMELEIAAIEHGEPLPPPTKETTMTDEKSCTKCGKKLRADNTKGICGDSVACSKRAGGTDEAVLERLERLEPKAEAPPKSKRVKPPAPAGPDWQAQFFQLAGALGLNPEEMLTDFCRGWVEDTRRRALGTSKPETPVSE